MSFSPSELRSAIEQGDRAAVIRALDNGADIEEADMHGEPGLPLRMACFDGHLGIVTELIRRGAKVADHARSSGPLRTAKRGGHQEIVRLLIAHGASARDDIKLAADDNGERRRGGDRRKRKGEPYLGDRRGPDDRRATTVTEVDLSSEQWHTYFSDLAAIARPDPEGEFDEAASHILARARD